MIHIVVRIIHINNIIHIHTGWQNQGYACYIVTRTYTEKVGLIDWRKGKKEVNQEKRKGNKEEKGNKRKEEKRKKHEGREEKIELRNQL